MARSPTAGSAKYVTCSCSCPNFAPSLRHPWLRCVRTQTFSIRYGAVAGITLRRGDYETTFRPDLAMLCTSLKYGGDEFVALPRTLTEFKAGGATGIPLVHPWINRLGRRGYEIAGRPVSLAGAVLPLDANGLPIHGNLFAAPFRVERESESRIVASFDYGGSPDR